MAVNNSLNLNTITPLPPSIGGTGVSNGTNTLTINANSVIDQDVSTAGLPSFDSVQGGNLTLQGNTLSSFSGDISISPAGASTIIGDFASGLSIGEVQITQSSQVELGLGSFSNSAVMQPLFSLYKSRSDTVGTRTSVVIADKLGDIGWYGDDGTDLTSSAATISCSVAGTVSEGIIPGVMTFSTADDTGVMNSVMQMDSVQICTFFNGIATTPVASSSSSLTLGNAYQNTQPYDILLTVYIGVTLATSGNITSGVASSATPAQQTLISGLTLSSLTIIPVVVYVPSLFYALISTTGTITASILGQQAMAI